MGSIAAAALGLVLASAAPTWAARPYTARCPGEDRNVLTVQTARAVVTAQCDCAGAESAGGYLRCAKREAKRLAQEGRLPRPCRRVVVDFERAGTCGRQSAALCCRANGKGVAKASASPDRASSWSCSAPTT